MSMIDAIREMREYMNTGDKTTAHINTSESNPFIDLWAWPSSTTISKTTTLIIKRCQVFFERKIPRIYVSQFVEAYTEL